MATNIGNVNYGTVGSSSAPLLLKSNGTIRCLWGNKFIDLIKNGKINADTKLIFTLDLVGVNDGIYIVNDIPYVVSNGKQIKLIEDKEEIAKSEQKVIFNTLDELNDVLNGLAYVILTNKLYTIKDGIKLEYINTLSTTTEVKSSEFSLGANNLYSDFNDIVLEANGAKSLRVTPLGIIASSVSTDTITGDSFKLYSLGGYSVLEVDKIIEKSNKFNNFNVFPKQYYLNNNIIKDIVYTENKFYITFAFKNTYKDKDEFIVYYVYNELLYEVVFTMHIEEEDIYVTSDSAVEDCNCLVGRTTLLIKSYFIDDSGDEQVINNFYINKEGIFLDSEKIEFSKSFFINKDKGITFLDDKLVEGYSIKTSGIVLYNNSSIKIGNSEFYDNFIKTSNLQVGNNNDNNYSLTADTGYIKTLKVDSLTGVQVGGGGGITETLLNTKLSNYATKSDLNYKQDLLYFGTGLAQSGSTVSLNLNAGNGISISGNTISCTVSSGGSGGDPFDTYIALKVGAVPSSITFSNSDKEKLLNFSVYFDGSNLISLNYTFKDCKELTSVSLPQCNNVEQAQYTFLNCENLVSFSVEKPMEKLTTALGMFEGCKSLSSVDLTFMPNVNNINGLFSGCESLTSANLSKLSKINTLGKVFKNCSNLRSVYFPLCSGISLDETFRGCSSIQSINLITISNPTITTNTFKGCTSLNTVNFSNVEFNYSGEIFPSSVKSITGTLSKVENLDVTKLTQLNTTSCKNLINGLTLNNSGTNKDFRVPSNFSSLSDLAKTRGWNLIII